MEHGEDGFYRFVVFVPHISARAAFDSYRRGLTIAGNGQTSAAVFSVPAVAPVAVVNAPASKPALKALAALLRRQSLVNDGGKISAGGEAVTARLPDGNLIAGTPLSLSTPLSGISAIDCIEMFPRLVLALGIFHHPPIIRPECPAIKFTAAAVANMTLRALPYEHSYSWTIGEAQWLPPPGRRGKLI
jgi:hypothetical protein